MPTARPRQPRARLWSFISCLAWALAASSLTNAARAQTALRVATFNLQDVRSQDLIGEGSPRARRLAEIIQRIAPNVILLNEIAYDNDKAPDDPAYDASLGPGLNGQRFARLLTTPQVPGLPALRYRVFMGPVNTGMPSGLDLNNDGQVVSLCPPAAGWSPDAPPGPPGPDARAYGEDCWGFGTFPGQYGMALLIDERLTIVEEDIRTFRLLPWDYLPGAFLPQTTEGKPWYSEEELRVARLSSKSHWDVPIRLADGRVIHFLCSHPTPPAFDGPEQRNARRNHDEIRFWADYITNASYIVDDHNRPGGLQRRETFVILGDLNADPDEGASFKQPIMNTLKGCERISLEFVPRSTVAWPDLDDDDTSLFKMRVDYVIPSRNLEVLAGGVWRPALKDDAKPASWPSDHFPVWLDLQVPPMLTYPPPSGGG